jgi:hypothetical protein
MPLSWGYAVGRKAWAVYGPGGLALGSELAEEGELVD